MNNKRGIGIYVSPEVFELLEKQCSRLSRSKTEHLTQLILEKQEELDSYDIKTKNAEMKLESLAKEYEQILNKLKSLTEDTSEPFIF